MYCDIHGHSTAKNIFLYGCTNNESPDEIMKERIFPIILH
jgi:hypothetical protein